MPSAVWIKITLYIRRLHELKRRIFNGKNHPRKLDL